jgi:hypothetical protein
MFSFYLMTQHNVKTFAKKHDILLSVVTSTLHQYTETFLFKQLGSFHPFTGHEGA